MNTLERVENRLAGFTTDVRLLMQRVEELEAFVDDIANADEDVWITEEVTVERIGGYGRTEPVGVNYSQKARLLLGMPEERS